MEEGKQRKLELSGEKKNSQKTIISQREGEKKELAGKGIEKEKEVRFSVDIDILEEVKREIKECKDGLKKEVKEIKKEIRHDNKRVTDSIEEGKKREKNWEIIIRLIEDKIDEIDREIKELTEIVGYKGRRCNPMEEDERSEESLRERSSISRRSNSYRGSLEVK